MEFYLFMKRWSCHWLIAQSHYYDFFFFFAQAAVSTTAWAPVARLQGSAKKPIVLSVLFLKCIYFFKSGILNW